MIAWIVAVLSVFSMLPWAIDATRQMGNTVVIALVNLFLGWSLVGWVVALVLPLTSEPAPTTVVVHQPSYPPPVYGQPYQPYQAQQIAPPQPG